MHILIVEDEPIIGRRLQRILKDLVGQNLQHIQCCHTIQGGLMYLEQHEIDLLFLDLNLHGEDGFSVLSAMVSAPFHTIIVSAYKEKAITAFEYGVLDFVPKPFNEERIAQALGRFQHVPFAPKHATRYLSIHKRGRHILKEIEALEYVKGAGIYSELFFQDGSKEVHNKNMDKLSQLLPPHFDRIHKSYIVNSLFVKEIIAEPGSRYSVVLENGTQLPVSRARIKELRKKWSI